MLIPPPPPSKPKRVLLGFLDDEPADHSNIESSKQSSSMTKADAQSTPLQRTQDEVESDTHSGKSKFILMLFIERLS